jgi:hypothetical protein
MLHLLSRAKLASLHVKGFRLVQALPQHKADHVQARVHVPDDRFLWLVDVFKPKSEVSAFLEVVDIAGLVKYVSATFRTTI